MQRRHWKGRNRTSSKDQSINSLDKYYRKQSSTSKPCKFDESWTSPFTNGIQPALQGNSRNILYPRNPEIRSYQLSIVRTCLFYNTLVCLPTGLGKTHIASVVMLNYYLTFPTGKIYFLAPTRPLVYQQKSSLAGFYQHINQKQIIELNGSLNSKLRVSHYKSKRIFFLTPQTLDNDLQQGRCDLASTSLIVFDEAHRATGNYAYVNIVKSIEKANIGYRIIGLSATPGNTIEQVQQVITNLKISRMEVKDETDKDVRLYVHHKQIEALEIKSSELIIAAQRLMDNFTKKPLSTLISKNIIEKYIVNLIQLRGVNPGVYFQIFDSFKNNEHEHKLRLGQADIGLVYCALKILKYLADGKKMLREQGYESFKSFLTKFKDKRDPKTGALLGFQKQIIESESYEKLMDMFSNASIHHPKQKKLQQILGQFFNDKTNTDRQSKVIIFTHHRTSAMEIKKSLQVIPLIKAWIFVGQSKTMEIISDINSNTQSVSVLQMKQKEQIEVIRKFKQNQLNTLISTSIGEQGLDIGQVDLIVCYDNGMSPIRMVQRMGRTGRKRNGRVVLLLMQGKEMQAYKKATHKSKCLKRVLRQNSLDNKNQKRGDLQFYSFNSVIFQQNTKFQIQYIYNQSPQVPTQDSKGDQINQGDKQDGQGRSEGEETEFWLNLRDLDTEDLQQVQRQLVSKESHQQYQEKEETELDCSQDSQRMVLQLRLLEFGNDQ